MKNYSSKQARGSKAAYRTPSGYRARASAGKHEFVPRHWDVASRLEHRQRREKKK